MSDSKKADLPVYSIIKKYEGFEIRKYPSLFIASTTIQSSEYDNSSSEGFRRIASFIFGANNENVKIKMTAPVIMEMKDSVEMAFIMPKSITPQNAPQPSDNSVKLKQRAEKIVAALSFEGWTSSSKLAQKEKELVSLLKKNNIEYQGDISYLGYNPPYQLIDRKNEILINVKLEQ